MTSLFLNRYKCFITPISENKKIYSRDDNPNILLKAFPNAKAMNNEYSLHKKAMNFVPCPKILDRFVEKGISYFAMERIKGYSVADMYGSGPIPKSIWKKIHTIVSKLYDEDIHYVDITPYNFMIEQSTNKIYVIDFGDAYECKVNWFLKDFLKGKNYTWNSDFE